MTYHMRSLVIVIAMTMVIVEAYRNEERIPSLNADVASYHRSRPRNFFPNQPFIDKIIAQQTSHMPTRNQAISQQAIHDMSFKEQSTLPGFPIFRHQPFKQDSFRMVTTFKDEPLFRGALLRNQESRDEEEIFRNAPFAGQSASPAPNEILEEQASAYGTQASLKKQLFTAEMPFKNLLQSPSSEQASLQKQAAFVEFPPDAIKFHRDDSYNKPIDSYGRLKDAPTTSYGGPAIYTEYGDHGLSSMPMFSTFKQFLPLDVEMFPTPSSVPVVRQESPMSAISSGVNDVQLSETMRMKLGPIAMSVTPSFTSKCNTLMDNSSTMFSDTQSLTTIPSISVSANQSSVMGHILTSLTTKPCLPVMTTTPIIPFAGNTLGPIRFHATKHGAVLTPSPTAQNELKSYVYNYLLPESSKSNLKIDEHNFKYLLSKVPKNNMKTDSRSFTLDILSEEHKGELKDDIQNFANYALPEVFKHGWVSQQFSQPETMSSYVPLSSNGKMKFILPSIPLAPALPISWPPETKADISWMLPEPLMASDEATSNNLSLGVDLPLDFMASMPNSLRPSIPNGISESITDGISTSIPGGMTADMPASIPTLNPGQSLHRTEQLRQTQEARNPWYSTGLQLQLGGFGGINYTLHTSNPAARPMELEIAKTGLTLPKLPQLHAPAFAKMEFGY